MSRSCSNTCHVVYFVLFCYKHLTNIMNLFMLSTLWWVKRLVDAARHNNNNNNMNSNESLFWHILVHANRLPQFCLFGGHIFWRIWFSARTFQDQTNETCVLFLTLTPFSPLQIYPAMDMDSANSVVLQALTQATSQDTAVLKPAEEQLRQWETQPGFYSVLLVRNDVRYLTRRCLKLFLNVQYVI